MEEKEQQESTEQKETKETTDSKPSTLASILAQQEAFSFDKEECFTLRYDDNSKNLAAGYSTGVLAIYNFEKPETDPEYRKA